MVCMYGSSLSYKVDYTALIIYKDVDIILKKN